MEPIVKTFDERLQEIDAYLELLQALERQVQIGPPTIGGSPITAQQQKILYAAVYLQLYNLVEATATWCIDGIAAATARGGKWKPSELSPELQREWVRTTARTHIDLNVENRFQSTFQLFETVASSTPIREWSVEKGGGNWDDFVLEEIAKRLGLQLQVSKPVYQRIKRVLRDDKAPLVLVRFLRNKLAHGALSFTECGENVTVSDLRSIKDAAANYLREVIQHFQQFIDQYMFLVPSSRPAPGGAT